MEVRMFKKLIVLTALCFSFSSFYGNAFAVEGCLNDAPCCKGHNCPSPQLCSYTNDAGTAGTCKPLATIDHYSEDLDRLEKFLSLDTNSQINFLSTIEQFEEKLEKSQKFEERILNDE
jgi:hypothetical protein